MGAYVSLNMKGLEPGTKFKKHQLLAHTKNFDDNGMYCSGKNVFMAVMNYDGFSHEDSYVISSDMAESMQRDIVKQAQVVIPPNTKLIRMETEKNKNITSSDVLVEFSYDQDIEEYLETNDLLNVDDDTEEVLSSFSAGDDTIKLLAQEGEIVDFRIYINNKNSIDKQIVNEHSKMVRETKKIIGDLASTADQKYKAVDNLDLSFMKTGGHKLKGGVEFLGAKIVYSIKQKKPLNIGDKLAGRYGKKLPY